MVNNRANKYLDRAFVNNGQKLIGLQYRLDPVRDINILFAVIFMGMSLYFRQDDWRNSIIIERESSLIETWREFKDIKLYNNIFLIVCVLERLNDF